MQWRILIINRIAQKLFSFSFIFPGNYARIESIQKYSNLRDGSSNVQIKQNVRLMCAISMFNDFHLKSRLKSFIGMIRNCSDVRVGH